MENCTIYSHYLNFERVVEIVKTALPKASVNVKDGGKQKQLIATQKGGFFGKDKKLTINYRERENPSYKLEKIECGLTQNLAGMANFIKGIPASNEAVKTQLLYKVLSLNCEMAFMVEPKITSEFEKILLQILQALDAIVFAQPNNAFAQSNTQHFLNKNLSLILDQNGRSIVSELEVKVDSKYHEQYQPQYSQEQLKRKEQSEAYLTEKNVQINKNLPCVPEEREVKIRTSKELSDRIFALLLVAAKGEGLGQQQLEAAISGKEVDSFSLKEQEIIDKETLSNTEKLYATWRYESLNTLLWAVGMLPELNYPIEVCNVQQVVTLVLEDSREDFEKRIQLKSKTAILNQLDLIYRMHWACVNARIKGQQPSGNLNSSIVYERHYALNWLTNHRNQDWDNVDTST